MADSTVVTEGQQLRQVAEALRGAFDNDKTGLNYITQAIFGQGLDMVAGGQSLNDAVFNLAVQARAAGRMPQLIEEAYEQKPDNPQLRALFGTVLPTHALPLLIDRRLPNPPLFLGRDQALAQIIEVLRAADCRLILIYGTGGTGKTTLVTRLARQMAGDPFTTIIWSSAIGKADWGLTHLLRDIGALVPDVARLPTLEQQQQRALEYLNTVPTLLICDNLNTVTADADQRQVSDFLASMDPSAGSRLLLTSRREDPWLQALVNPAGNFHFLLEGLPEAAAVQMLRALAGAKKINRLAQAPDEELAPLADAVFYNPKLIELLVGQGDYQRIQRVAERLPSTLEQARTTLLNESFTRLDQTPGALALLQQVPAFVPSANYTALEAVCTDNLPEGTSFETAFEAALSSALLSYDETVEERRYRLHPLVESYMDATPAFALTDQDQIDEIASSLVVYFFEFAAARRNHTLSANRMELAREWDNLRNGWQMAEKFRQNVVAQAAEEEPETSPDTANAEEQVAESSQRENDLTSALAAIVIGYAESLFAFAITRGWLDDAQELVTIGLNAARQVSNTLVEGDLLGGLAMLEISHGRAGEARELIAQSMIALQEHKDLQTIIATWQPLMEGPQQAPQIEELRQRFEASLIAARQLDIPGLEVSLLNQLAMLDLGAGNLASAQERLNESMALARLAQNEIGQAETLFLTGRLVFSEGKFAEARRYLEEALELARRIGYPLMEAQAQNLLAPLLCISNEMARARTFLEEAITTYEKLLKPRESLSARMTLQMLEAMAGIWAVNNTLVRVPGVAERVIEEGRAQGRPDVAAAWEYLQTLVIPFSAEANDLEDLPDEAVAELKTAIDEFPTLAHQAVEMVRAMISDLQAKGETGLASQLESLIPVMEKDLAAMDAESKEDEVSTLGNEEPTQDP